MLDDTERGAGDCAPLKKHFSLEYKSDSLEEYGPKLKILPSNNQVRELQTILRDRNTTRSDFKFYADRLIRLVIEESLNQLPFTKCVITTPTGAEYNGLRYERGNCGVSIVRSGEAMEQGLRDCCRSIRIGKILVESDAETHEARVVYARFPEDIALRKVLLMYPIMSTGNTVVKAVNVLKEHNVAEENIILSNLFSTPYATKSIIQAFPQMSGIEKRTHRPHSRKRPTTLAEDEIACPSHEDNTAAGPSCENIPSTGTSREDIAAAGPSGRSERLGMRTDWTPDEFTNIIFDPSDEDEDLVSSDDEGNDPDYISEEESESDDDETDDNFDFRVTPRCSKSFWPEIFWD